MRVFIYEYTCARGTGGHALATRLQVEGWAMLSAFLEDFGRISGVQTLTLIEERCAHDDRGGHCRRVREPEHESAFRELATMADFTLLIAPEFDDILLTLCRWVGESGGRLLGPSVEAVRLTGDKLALSSHLLRRCVPSPASRLYRAGEPLSTTGFPAVWKPRHGAGSQATFLVKDSQELNACIGRARAEGWQGEALVQPFVPGLPASVAFLAGERGRIPLLPAAQRLSDDGRFRYLGGAVPLSADLSQRAVQAATRAIATIPDLRGYVGVDLVLGHAEDGSEDAVIEINPRPTTSYVGLRALAETNLTEAMLHFAMGNGIANLLWRNDMVRFDADGAVRFAGSCR
jgi:predicted ATP-grasp superfamily ATP-dependent carboligase